MLIRSPSWSFVAAFALSLVAYGCAGDGADTPQEPVAPTTEETPYPEDPDMAPKPDEGTAPKDDVPDGVGELTADPFEGKKSPDDALAESTPNDEVLPPPDEGDTMGGALEGNEPNYKSSPGTSPDVPGEKAAKAGKKAKKGKGAAAGKGKQQRYVDAVMLNVRGKPAKGAPVVRRLLGGAMIHVEMHGKWAKIKEGQWVRTKYLAAEPTKKVSRAEADKAWHQSKSGKKASKGKTAKASAKAKKGKTSKVAPAPAPVPDAADPMPAEEPSTEPDALPEEAAPATDG